MGLLDKVKNLFTEEVEEPVVKKEEPKKRESRNEIHTQERTVEIAPARRESTVLLDNIEDDIPIKREEKNNRPIYFSDDAFEDLEKPVVKRHEEVKPKREIYSAKKEENKDNKKLFKPSPIISPVYGILDKNYSKDDITTREVPINREVSKKTTVDDIRNKAYGTLEDELESNLLDDEVIISKEVENTPIDIFDELETRESRNSKLEEDYEIEEELDISSELEKQKQKIEEINEIIKSNVKPENKKITSRKIDNILEELDEIEELIPDTKKEEIDELEELNKIEEQLIEEEISSDEDSYDEELEKVEDEDDYDYMEDDFPYDEDEELEDDTSEEIEEDIEEEENTSEESEDDLDESELFNLIDSMYEKRDE